MVLQICIAEETTGCRRPGCERFIEKGNVFAFQTKNSMHVECAALHYQRFEAIPGRSVTAMGAREQAVRETVR